MLHQSRCVDESQNPVTENKTAHQFVMLAAIRMYGNITDTLTGKRQVFGMRSHHYAVAIMMENRRVRQSVVYNFAICLVAYQKNLRPVLRPFPAQQLSQLPHKVLTVDNACWVIG